MGPANLVYFRFMKFKFTTIIKQDAKQILKKLNIFKDTFIQPCKVWEAGKLEDDRWSYHQEPISTFA